MCPVQMLQKIICVKPAVLTLRHVANLAMKHLSILYCGYPILVRKIIKNKFLSVASIVFNEYQFTEAIKYLSGNQHMDCLA